MILNTCISVLNIKGKINTRAINLMYCARRVSGTLKVKRVESQIRTRYILYSMTRWWYLLCTLTNMLSLILIALDHWHNSPWVENNTMPEHRAIFQRERQNSQVNKQTKSVNNRKTQHYPDLDPTSVCYHTWQLRA